MNANQRYDSVQLMRGVAAVSVIFTHILMINNGGFGVDLFFCISGFIMMHITRTDCKDFLLKRVIRIVPLYWIATFSTAALLFTMPNVFRTSVLSSENLVKSLLFIPSIMSEGTTGQNFSLLTVGWTLVMEIFFYIIFFVSMKINHGLRHVITTIFFVIMVASGLLVSTDNIFIVFYCRPVILEFSLGMFAYKILMGKQTSKQINKQINKQTGVLLIAFSVLIWASLFAVKHIPFLSDLDRFLKHGLPSFLFFILIFKYFEHKRIPQVFILVGNVSYSLYLTHTFIVQGFSRLVYNIDEFTVIGVLLSLFVVIPLCIGVAWVSWYLVENRFTDWVRKRLGV